MPKDLFDYSQYLNYQEQGAAAERAAATQAADIAKETAAKNIDVFREFGDKAIAGLAPFKQAGSRALNQLNSMLTGQDTPLRTIDTTASILDAKRALGAAGRGLTQEALDLAGLSANQVVSAIDSGISADKLGQALQRGLATRSNVFEPLQDSQGNLIERQDIGLSRDEINTLRAAPTSSSEQVRDPSVFTDPLAADAQLRQQVLNDPLLQRTIDESLNYGVKGLERSASAKGALRSGRTVEELFQFGSRLSLDAINQEVDAQRQQRLAYNQLKIQGLLGQGQIGLGAATAQAQAILGTGQQIAGANQYAGTAGANAALAVGNIQSNLFNTLGQVNLQRQLDRYLFTAPGGLGGAPNLSGGPNPQAFSGLQSTTPQRASYNPSFSGVAPGTLSPQFNPNPGLSLF